MKWVNIISLVLCVWVFYMPVNTEINKSFFIKYFLKDFFLNLQNFKHGAKEISPKEISA